MDKTWRSVVAEVDGSLESDNPAALRSAPTRVYYTE